MDEFIIRGRNHSTIEDWRQWTRPKKPEHWKAGRSAMELARSWFTSRQPQCPLEVERLLASHPDTTGIKFVEGQPEFVTPLPESGEGRNHDLVIWGLRGDERVTLCIEAKADETFGSETIGGYWKRKKEGSEPTRAPERIERLLRIVFGSDTHPLEEPWISLRYQVLTGVAGTLLQTARGGNTTGIFVIQEFQTNLTDPNKLRVNQDDYNKFVQALFGKSATNINNSDGFMYGPLSYAADRFIDSGIKFDQMQLHFFMGKCTSSW